MTLSFLVRFQICSNSENWLFSSISDTAGITINASYLWLSHRWQSADRGFHTVLICEPSWLNRLQCSQIRFSRRGRRWQRHRLMTDVTVWPGVVQSSKLAAVAPAARGQWSLIHHHQSTELISPLYHSCRHSPLSRGFLVSTCVYYLLTAFSASRISSHCSLNQKYVSYN